MGNLCGSTAAKEEKYLCKDDVLAGLITSEGTFGENYKVGKQLGVGQYGTAYVCESVKTGKKFAVKSIAKEKLKTKLHLDDVKREVQIMRHLNGTRNIVTLEDVYEDSTNIHLVMELCTGGELFDSISAAGHFSERKAAAVFRVILEVVSACHAKGVIHRDLKPGAVEAIADAERPDIAQENFLLSDKSDKAVVKAIDFGQSTFFTRDQKFDDPMGSAYYIAPEMLAGSYSAEADVWACGVILYILLSGVPPFYSEDVKQIYEMVKVAEVDFTDEPWPKVSDSAKNLIRKLCERDVRKRLTAEAALKHPWIVSNTTSGSEHRAKPATAKGDSGATSVASSIETSHASHAPAKPKEKDGHHHHHHPAPVEEVKH